MISFAIQIHRNILSSQCYIRYVDDSNSVDTLKITSLPTKLCLSFLGNNEIIQKVHICTPVDFFIPSSLFAGSTVTLKDGPAIVCRTKLSSTGQSIAETTFRLQVSDVKKLEHFNEVAAVVDVKDYFKKLLKKSLEWDLSCGKCGHLLPLAPLAIDCVKEYSESELSEGWFCHGNMAQDTPQPLKRVLYIDDVSFLLHPSLYVHKNIHFTKSAAIDNSIDHINMESEGQQNIKCVSKTIQNSSNINCNYSSDPNSDYFTVKDISSTDNLIIPLGSSDTRCQPNKSPKHSDVLSNNHSAFQGMKCEKCGDLLTAEKFPSPFTRFYFDKLLFKNSSYLEEDIKEYASKVAMLSFWCLMAKSQTSSLVSKLFLQSKVLNEDVCLLLWIPSSPVLQFVLQEDSENLPEELGLELKPAYTVLYFVGPPTSSNVRSWRHDFSVDYHRVSDTLLTEVIKQLEESSKYLLETTTEKGFRHASLPVNAGCD